MTPRYRSAKKDANHAEIVAALKAVGCSVVELHAVGGGVPDLLVGYNGWDYLLEVKRPGVAGKARGARQAATNEKQKKFRDDWRGHTVAVVDSVSSAFLAVNIASKGL